MWRRVLVVIGVLASALLAACGGGSGGSSDEVTVGASLPLSGPLASFGPLIEEGYKEAFREVNAKGGIEIDGEKRKVRLLVRDNASDPRTASQQSRSLALKDGAVALLGSVSPPLNIQVSNVADSQRIPTVMTLTPEQAWLAGNEAGWKYAWDIGFDEGQMTDLQYKTADLTRTNKRIALFTDNEDDGVKMGQLWTDKAPAAGYTIAYHAKFPVGTKEYGDFIARAKEADAEVVIAQMLPPDGFALWKQMKALGYRPKVAFCEKCAGNPAWQAELGPLSNGTGVIDYWSEERGGLSPSLLKRWKDEYGNLDLSAVAGSYTAAKVLLDAIARAGSTEPDAINAAIGETRGKYPLGDVRFDSQNRYPVEAIQRQWQGADANQVYPAGPVSKPLQAPVEGLR